MCPKSFLVQEDEIDMESYTIYCSCTIHVSYNGVTEKIMN